METMWKQLRQQIDKPLSGVPETAIQISENLFQVQEAFVLTSDHYRNFNPASEAIIRMVMWAPSKGAALRAFKNNIEADDGEEGDIPIDMRLTEDATTFESIRTIGKSQGINFMESATYRIMVDGAFVHRELQSRSYRAYFRSRHDLLNEAPYAIAITV